MHFRTRLVFLRVRSQILEHFSIVTSMTDFTPVSLYNVIAMSVARVSNRIFVEGDYCMITLLLIIIYCSSLPQAETKITFEML